MRWVVFLLFFILSLDLLYAQSIEPKEIPFFIQAKALLNPTTGGVNNAQVSMGDIDLDGYQDIIIFDRHGDVIIPMTYFPGLKTYKYRPELKRIFPKVYDWVIMKDYNDDKIPDIFAFASTNHAIDGIEVYRGVVKNNQLAFVPATNGRGNKILRWNTGSGETQIYVSRIDIPTFDDVDADGDLDILTFGNGAIHVEWYKNMAVERGWSKDSLIYIRQSDCYGGFKEGGFNGDIFLSSTPGDCNRLLTNQSRHAGSTLLSTDLNKDGLKDLLIGDLSSNNLVAVFNGGSLSNAWMNRQDSLWNSKKTGKANITIFVAAFEIDANQDGVQDIIACPNSLNSSINSNNMHLFTGKIDQGILIHDLSTKSFLVDEMLDFGARSYPCFVDFNQDGLMDLLVGTEGEFFTSNTRTGGLVLFENRGTKSKPEFHLKDSNYLDFQRFSLASMGVRSFTPNFGDLDGDGDLDMLCGESSGGLFYCENIAGPSKAFVFKNPIYSYQNIIVNSNSVPFLIDLNRDGLLDILCGSQLSNDNDLGELCSSMTYFQNQGTKNSPFFDPNPNKLPNTECVGNAILEFDYSSYSTPFVYDFNGKHKIFSGNEKGSITIFEDIESNIYSQFKKINTHYGDINEGSSVSLSLADIDNDGVLDMAIGNSRGGISFYSTDYQLDGTKVISKDPKQTNFELMPNPILNYFIIKSSEDVELEIVIQSLDSKRLMNKKIMTNTSVEMENLIPGIYMVNFEHRGKSIVKKLIKL